MITEKELLDAIDECEREPITASKVGKLADLYTIYDHLYGYHPHHQYSQSTKVENPKIQIKSDTEFLAAVNGKEAEKVLFILDELMEATKALHPRMYDQILEKISDI